MSQTYFDIDTIKREIPILEVAASLGIKVRFNKAMCFGGHDKKSQSLTFTPSKNLWHCFGCGKGGSAIDLVKEVHGLDIKQALAWLKHAFLLRLPATSTFPRRTSWRRSIPRNPISRAEPAFQCEPDPEVYEWFLGKCSTSRRAFDYLKQRGFSRQTIDHFKIKDLLYPARSLRISIRKWGIDRLIRCGLAKKLDLQQPAPARYRLAWWDYTILFPFMDGDRVIYIQGRRLSADPPKYVNLIGVRKPIFNINALASLRRGSTVYICEGIPDTLAAVQRGWNAVGILGASSFRAEWVRHFSEFKVVIVPDMDDAGTHFAIEVQQLFKRQGQVVQSALLPYGKDLCEFLNKNQCISPHSN